MPNTAVATATSAVTKRRSPQYIESAEGRLLPDGNRYRAEYVEDTHGMHRLFVFAEGDWHYVDTIRKPTFGTDRDLVAAVQRVLRWRKANR